MWKKMALSPFLSLHIRYFTIQLQGVLWNSLSLNGQQEANVSALTLNTGLIWIWQKNLSVDFALSHFGSRLKTNTFILMILKPFNLIVIYIIYSFH